MTKKKSGKVDRQRSKKMSQLRHHKRSMIGIGFILLLLAGVLTVNSFMLQAKNKEYKSQEAELEAEIQKEKERSEEIEDYEEYVKSDEYIKETAEEKLGQMCIRDRAWREEGEKRRQEMISAGISRGITRITMRGACGLPVVGGISCWREILTDIEDLLF